MYHTQPLPVYITSNMTGGVKPTPVYAVNATSEWVTPAEFYAYTGGSETEPPAPAPSTYATIDSVDFALASKADKSYVDTQLATKATTAYVDTKDSENIKKNTASTQTLTTGTLELSSNTGTDSKLNIEAPPDRTAYLNVGAIVAGNSRLTIGRGLTQPGYLYFGTAIAIAPTNGNSANRIWTLPQTSGNVSFLHNGPDNIGNNVAITAPAATNMNFKIDSATTNNTILTIGANSAASYIVIGKATNAGGVENGAINFGASAQLTTASGNTTQRKWTLPSTTSNVEFLHTGAESQTKTGTLVLGGVRCSASGSIITSIETTMPASPTNSQLLTALAIKNAIGGGGGSYLPLAGGAMDNDAVLQIQGPATRIEGWSSSIKKIQIEPLTTGGKLTIMDSSGNVGIRLEGSQIVGNTYYANTSYGIGNVTINSAATTGTTWTIPDKSGSKTFASMEDISIQGGPDLELYAGASKIYSYVNYGITSYKSGLQTSNTERLIWFPSAKFPPGYTNYAETFIPSQGGVLGLRVTGWRLGGELRAIVTSGGTSYNVLFIPDNAGNLLARYEGQPDNPFTIGTVALRVIIIGGVINGGPINP